MYPLVFFALLAWLSFCLAKLEIQIEDGHGWAELLPTWRLPREHWVSRVFFSGKPATGYHIWLEVFLFSMLHVVYIYIPFTVAHEMQIFAFFFYFCVLEDFFWFVFNPTYGIKKFRKENIWWHRDNWFFIVPSDYVTLTLIASALYVASFYVIW